MFLLSEKSQELMNTETRDNSVHSNFSGGKLLRFLQFFNRLQSFPLESTVHDGHSLMYHESFPVNGYILCTTMVLPYMVVAVSIPSPRN